ncbi:MAG: transcriptional antiterminator RfaH [Pseudoalteromonas tetraodonis]|jgi:transcriptional antiterminator RfaH
MSTVSHSTSIESHPLKWYCVQTRPKSEHIAAAGLVRFEGVETYCPRIRFQKVTQRGKVWFTEALFPNYIFVKFEVETYLRAVRSSQAVLRVVGFGDFLGEVPDAVVEGIRAEMGGESIYEVAIPLREGEEVEVAQGPFAGMKGIVTKLLNGDQRVQILMEMLGREHQVEVKATNLKSQTLVREVLADLD